MRVYTTLALPLLLATALIAETSQEKAVKASIETFRVALTKRDRATLDKLTAPELWYSHSDGRFEGKKEFLDANSDPSVGYDAIEFGPTTFQTRDDTVLARGDWMVKLKRPDGSTADMKFNVLQVWTKTKAGWQMAARQSTRRN